MGTIYSQQKRICYFLHTLANNIFLQKNLETDSLDLFRFTFVAQLSNNQVLTIYLDKPGIQTECVFVSLNGASQQMSIYMKAILELTFAERLECAWTTIQSNAKI